MSVEGEMCVSVEGEMCVSVGARWLYLLKHFRSILKSS